MATEFDDSAHYGIFLSGTTLTSSTGNYVRQSEMVLSALRSQGVFDNMEDGTTAPATDKLWLDKNTDPAILKEYDAIGSSWVAMSFDRLFSRATVISLTITGGTADAIVVSEPSIFMSGKLYSVTASANNTGATTIQVTGVGTYDAKYPDGTALAANELYAGKVSIFIFQNGRFELLFGYASQASAADSATAALANGLYASTYGASPSASAATNTTAIQAAIDACAALGGGVVRLTYGEYTCNQLIFKDRVILEGVAIQSTTLKAADSLNDNFIETNGYDALVTATNKWLVSDGVLSFCGFRNLQIDGNKANQTSGDGVRMYAKGLVLDNVLIRDCYGVGLLTYGGDVSGQSDWYDLPEGQNGPIYIRNCGSHGWQMRGPHDCIVPQLVINACGGDGLRIERSVNDYSGSPDIGIAHIYANTGYGVYSNTAFRARQLISESNEKEGIYLDGAAQVQIGMLQLYRNCNTSGSYQMQDTTTCYNNVISQCLIRTPPDGNDVGGAQITGDYMLLKDCQIIGAEPSGGFSSGIGIDVTADAYWFRGSGIIRQFKGGSGIGLQSGGGASGMYDFAIQDCDTLWNNAAAGNWNHFNLTGYAASGQTVFSGDDPNTNDSGTWNVNLSANGTLKNSQFKGISSSFAADAVAGTTANQTFTHNLLTTPNIEDVQVSMHVTDSGGGTSFGAADIGVVVQSVSSTQIVTKTRINTAAAAGSLGYVSVQVSL